MIHWQSGYYVKAKWGVIDFFSLDGRKEKFRKFGISLTHTAFTQRDGKSYIEGSSIYFDQQETRLHGDGWTLEYKPL